MVNLRHLTLTFDVESYFGISTRRLLCESYRLATQQTLWRQVRRRCRIDPRSMRQRLQS